MYRLKFIDAQESVVRVSAFDAPDDAHAVELSCSRCVNADMPVELYDGDRHIVRMTPMIARLYLAITSDYRH